MSVNCTTFLDNRLAGTLEPFRSGARPLAAGMRDALVASNAAGVPPVVPFVRRIREVWPNFRIDDNVKAIAGMLVAEVLAPSYRPCRRKSAPRGAIMASGALFLEAVTLEKQEIGAGGFMASDVVSDDIFHLGREALERAAEVFSGVKAGKPYDQKRRNHLRLAITALQMANAEPA